MSGPVKSFLRTAAVSLLTFAPPPRVTAFLRGREGGRLLSPRGAGPRRSDNTFDSLAEQKHVVVLGGGFGGVYTTLRLTELLGTSDNQPPAFSSLASDGPSIDNPQPPVAITVVDSKDRFVFLPLLYELATGQTSEAEVAPLLEDVLAGSGARFVQGSVSSVNLAARTITLSTQQTHTPLQDSPSTEEHAASSSSSTTSVLHFDRLVVAMGAEASPPANVPGAIEHSMPFYTIEDARRLKREIAKLAAAAETETEESSPQPQETLSAVVVGGGYSGVELACNLAERLGQQSKSKASSAPRVMLVHKGSSLLPASSEGSRKRALAALARANVEVRCGTAVEKVGEGSITVKKVRRRASGEEEEQEDEEGEEEQGVLVVPAKLVVWTAGSRPNTAVAKAFNAEAAAVVFDADGRLVVDSSLAVQTTEVLEEGGGGAHSGGSKDVVFALGDIASVRSSSPSSSSPPPSSLPATAQVAFQQSEYCAWNVYASLTGADAGGSTAGGSNALKQKEKKLAFRYTPLGELMSLGGADASVALPPALAGPLQALVSAATSATRSKAPQGKGGDSSGSGSGSGDEEGEDGLGFSGPLGYVARRLVYAARMPTSKQREIALRGLADSVSSSLQEVAKAKGETGG